MTRTDGPHHALYAPGYFAGEQRNVCLLPLPPPLLCSHLALLLPAACCRWAAHVQAARRRGALLRTAAAPASHAVTPSGQRVDGPRSSQVDYSSWVLHHYVTKVGGQGGGRSGAGCWRWMQPSLVGRLQPSALPTRPTPPNHPSPTQAVLARL